jgi:hypothetical protein
MTVTAVDTPIVMLGGVLITEFHQLYYKDCIFTSIQRYNIQFILPGGSNSFIVFHILHTLIPNTALITAIGGMI